MFNHECRLWPKQSPSSLAVPKTTIFDNLAVSARRYPDTTAIYYYGTAIQYERLFRETCLLAGYLQRELGVNKGDRVLLYMQNSPQFVISFHAILAVGAVVVPLNPMNMTEELQFYIQDSGTHVAIVGQELFDRIESLIGESELRHAVMAAYSDYIGETPKYQLPDIVAAKRVNYHRSSVSGWAAVMASNATWTPVDVQGTDLAVLPYTSGTTGRPKGCMHPHCTVQANIVGGATHTGTNSGSVLLGTLPLFHVTGMIHSMLTPLFCGSTVVLMTRWDRETAAQLIHDMRCTGWTNIATMLIDFLSNPNIANYDLSSLTAIGGGGAALPEAVGERLFQLTGIRYAEGYGLSETISQTHFNPLDRPKLQCLGMPSFDVDARVIHPESLIELGPNEDGELIIHGPQVFQGYWNRPEENERVFINIDGKRFFRTGDIVRYDEDGYFFMVDRLKRMINAAGFKVWPAEVESLLFEHEAVQLACVIGVPDARRGETVKAYIVLKPEFRGAVSEEDIIAWTKDKMAAYKRPRIVEFVDSLPISGSGKVLWRKLMEMEAAKHQQV